MQALIILTLASAWIACATVLACIGYKIWIQLWFWVERCGWLNPWGPIYNVTLGGTHDHPPTREGRRTYSICAVRPRLERLAGHQAWRSGHIGHRSRLLRYQSGRWLARLPRDTPMRRHTPHTYAAPIHPVNCEVLAVLRRARIARVCSGQFP